jgi:hypothetical protein
VREQISRASRPNALPNRVFGQESRSSWPTYAPSVDGMCFMFGASEEQVRHMLGLIEARHDDTLTGAGEAPVSAAASSQAWHSISVCADPPP